jgi:cell division protein FtsI (penicillin-binding protein 3)
VAALKLPGIGQDKEYRRFYPTGEMTAHMVGFTGVDDKGLEGVELAFHGQLLGHPGSRSVIKDRRGQIVEDVGSIKLPQDGKEIRLALDSKIQYLAYSHLKQAISDHKAKAGGVVVLDVRTGEILALANWPTYNPNNREALSGAQLRNRALTDTFEPGSTLKPFTIALGLETRQGSLRHDHQLRSRSADDWPGNHLRRPSARCAERRAGDPEIVKRGFRQDRGDAAVADDVADVRRCRIWAGAPQLGFPGEVTGRVRPWKSWRPIEQATMSYGHGISVSLIQLARAYSVFARDGDLVPLSLTRVDSAVASGATVFSAKTAREVRAMLEMAVQPGGTAPKAQIPGYRVAGKTGTAHKLQGGRYANKYVSSFVGFAPVSDPRLIVAVMIDEPSAGKHYGGAVAAPVFAAVMGSSLRTVGVAPDAPLVVAQTPQTPKAPLAAKARL